MVKNLKATLLATTLAVTPAFAAEGYDPDTASTETTRRFVISGFNKSRDVAVEQGGKSAAEQAASGKWEDTEVAKITFGAVTGSSMDGVQKSFVQLLVESGLFTADDAAPLDDEEVNSIASHSGGAVRRFVEHAVKEQNSFMEAMSQGRDAYQDGLAQGAQNLNDWNRLQAAFRKYSHEKTDLKTFLDAVKAADARDTLGIKDLDTADNMHVKKFLKADGNLSRLISFAQSSSDKHITEAMKDVQYPASLPMVPEALENHKAAIDGRIKQLGESDKRCVKKFVDFLKDLKDD